MLDEAKMLDSRIEFYKKDVDNPFSVNGFRGTWQFSDHTLIPDVLQSFLQRYFQTFRLKRVPLDEINRVMNEVWDGPGSLEKLFRLEAELKASGNDIKFTSSDIKAIKEKAKEEEDEEDFIIPDLALNEFGEEDFEDEEEEK